MSDRWGRRWAAIALLAALAGPAAGQEAAAGDGAEPDVALRLARSLDEPRLAARVAEILENNPDLAALRARARAARSQAPNRGLPPDPTLGATLFLAPPETRVGPQRLMLGLSQRWPGFGRLALEETAATLEASALAAEASAMGLRLVTEARRLWHELAFLEREREIAEEFGRHLLQHEEIARTRYATGIGPGQGVIKLQAAITRVESRTLEIESRREVLRAALEALADRVAAGPAPRPSLPRVEEIAVEAAVLEATAAARRPEVAAAVVRVERAATLSRLADRGNRPQLTFGLTYTAVEPRDDAGAQLQPPAGNGDDVFGLQAGVSLPWRRSRTRADRAAAGELERSARERERAVRSRIRAELGELAARISLGWRRLRLLEDVLIAQAEEALASARSGYVAGTLNALDLLDAEHVLFEAQTAVARAVADYAIDRARLEATVAAPLEEIRP